MTLEGGSTLQARLGRRCCCQISVLLEEVDLIRAFCDSVQWCLHVLVHAVDFGLGDFTREKLLVVELDDLLDLEHQVTQL